MRPTDDGGVRWEETENPSTRYAELGGNIRGLAAWATLVTTALTGEPLGALDAFLDATAPERRAPKPPRLFISHQRKDARRANGSHASRPRTASTTGWTSTTRR